MTDFDPNHLQVNYSFKLKALRERVRVCVCARVRVDSVTVS